MSDKIKVTLERSLAGKPEHMRAVAAALGLRKRGSSVVHDDEPSIRGMVRRIEHLVSVERVEGEVD